MSYRIAFEIAGHPVYWYGIMFALGILAGLWTGSRRAQLTSDVSSEQFLNSIPWVLIGTLMGARALFVITYWNDYFANQPWTEIFNYRNGGLVYFGGMICGIGCTLIYLLKNKIPVWSFFDIAAPSLALAHALGRVGCFINGCCYGRPTSLFLGVHYPEYHETHGVAVHPVQLYEAGLNLLLFAVLEYCFRHRKFRGQITAFYFIGYGVLRFIAELFRGDVPQVFLCFSQAQLIALAVELTGIALLVYLYHNTKRKA